MTTWHWVRHGPTHEKAFVGWRDVAADLSDYAQLARLDGLLPREAVLISSDLTRARQTADVLAEGRVRLGDHPDLREFHFGEWDGHQAADVARSHPELSRAYWETPGDVTPPGGESWNTAAARVARVVDALTAAHGDAHIVAVAHIGVILTQVQRALGVTPQEAIGHRIDNLSVTTLTVTDGAWRVEGINHCP